MHFKHFLLEDPTCYTCDATPEPQNACAWVTSICTCETIIFQETCFCFFVFLIFLSGTCGYLSERRRRDWWKTRVQPFTEAHRRWSRRRSSDNSSFLPPNGSSLCWQASGSPPFTHLKSFHHGVEMDEHPCQYPLQPWDAVCRKRDHKQTKYLFIYLCFLICEDCTLSACTMFVTVITHLSRELVAKVRPPSR